MSLSPTGLIEIEQIDLANGVKALIWPVRDEPGRLTVKVRFGGGYRSFGPKRAVLYGGPDYVAKANEARHQMLEQLADLFAPVGARKKRR